MPTVDISQRDDRQMPEYDFAPSPYRGIPFQYSVGARPAPVQLPAFRQTPVTARPIPSIGPTGGWNPGGSNYGSYFSGPYGGYMPYGIPYTGSPTQIPTTWTSTPGVNGGAVPRAVPVTGGGGGDTGGYSNPGGSGNMGFASGSGGWITQFMKALSSH